ncbi:MAG: DUF308 domain-containing protein [Ruminococcus sp.]|nr:DUF308 domain-containing protein [Ruminococcus sp.]
MKVFNCIMGIFSIFASIYCILMPGASFLATAGWIVAVLLGVIGICSLFEYSRNKESKKLIFNGTTLLVFGIGATVLSVIALFNPAWQMFFDIIIVLLFSVWLVISGIDSTAQSIKNKKSGIKSWWATLIFGILSILAGLYSGTHILIASAMLGIILGSVLMLYGIRLIGSVFEKEV